MTGIAGAADYKPAENPDVCWVCGGPWIKGKGGTSSHTAKAGAAFHLALNPPPVVQVCSEVCAQDWRFGDPHRGPALEVWPSDERGFAEDGGCG